jgi:hypothetical protein
MSGPVIEAEADLSVLALNANDPRTVPEYICKSAFLLGHQVRANDQRKGGKELWIVLEQ